MTNRLLLLLLLLLFASQGFGQYTLPKVSPPTPEAAGLVKYADYPVSHSTGVPEISFPVYEVKSGKLNLPISISYHSSGRKVYDESGAIGLGWTLNAGGMVSRVIYGDPDDKDNFIKFPSPWKKQAELSNLNTFPFLASVDNHPDFQPHYDTEYDVFSYSTGSISGKFILKDSSNVKKPVLIPKKPYHVVCHKLVHPYVNQFDYFELTDDKGVLYRFGKSLKDGADNTESSINGKSGWLLSEIISADRVDTIFFKYKTFQKERRTVVQDYRLVDSWWTNIGTYDAAPSPPGEAISESVLGEIYYVQRLAEIRFKHGKVVFNLEWDPYLNKELDLIKNIQVLNSSNLVVRAIEFKKSVLSISGDGIKPTHKLDGVSFKDRGEKLVEQYSFEYYPTVFPNSYTTFNVRFSDFWGYYNASGVLDARPYFVVPYNHPGGVSTIAVGNSNGNRNPNLDAMKSEVLKKITYPTGGTTEFIYQLNRYKDPESQIVKDCGGLRIYQIKTDDLNGNMKVKTYKYGVGENGYGFLPLVPAVENMSYENTYVQYDERGGAPEKGITYRERIFSSNVLPMFSYIAQKPVIYTEVTEYHGTEADNTGKTVYRYDYDDQIAPKSVQTLFLTRTYKYWKHSSLLERIDFRSTVASGVVSYDPVRAVQHNYLITENDSDHVYGLHIKKSVISSPNTVNDYYHSRLPISSDQYSATSQNYLVYSFGDYIISVGKKELSSTVETDYSVSGNFVKTTTYTYNQRHLLRKTTYTDSKGDTYDMEQKYPFDLASDAVHQAMLKRNMLNYLVEQHEFRSTTIPLKSIKTTYRDWGSNLIAPQTVSSRTGTLAYDNRLLYQAYDTKGNPRQVARANDVSHTYLWAYNGTLPVAEVSNAGASSVAYSSFESLNSIDNGNWSFSGPLLIGGRTGMKSYAGTVTSQSSLPNDTYLLSFWGKGSGSIAVNGTTMVQVSGSTWGYYQVKLTNPGQVIVSSGSIPIDELRLSPVNAQMITYTYDPLRGVTSATDPSNVTTFYDYDDYDRLLYVRDQDSNIIKSYKYQYRQ